MELFSEIEKYFILPETPDPLGVKELLIYETELFGDQVVIAMSDLHGQTDQIIRLLTQLSLGDQDPNPTGLYDGSVIIATGDMAGVIRDGKELKGRKGDADPFESYEFIAAKAAEFYFVQGNHDLDRRVTRTIPPIEEIRCGTVRCNVNRPIQSRIGMIGGINGIIGENGLNYRVPERTYLKEIAGLVREVDILLTHDCPAVNGSHGNTALYQTIRLNRDLEKRPLIHFYGHAHQSEPINRVKNSYFINLDGRVVIFKPPNTPTLQIPPHLGKRVILQIRGLRPQFIH